MKMKAMVVWYVVMSANKRRKRQKNIKTYSTTYPYRLWLISNDLADRIFFANVIDILVIPILPQLK